MKKTHQIKVGMSSDRLSRIQTKLQEYIDAKKAPGFVTAIARKGQIVHYEACGYQDIENKIPMEKDAIFRIYSMTKPITAVALMMLYEEGKFQLHNWITDFIPEFGKTKVLVGEDLVEQETPLTIKQLLTHTSGLTYSFMGESSVHEMYRSSQFANPTITLEEKVKEITQFPLLFQPGTQWQYSVGLDVCGYLVEVLSGMPFDTYVREKIFEPLGMVDTAFHVPKEKSDRLAQLYAHNPADGSLQIYQNDFFDLQRDFLTPTKSPQGGHGLVSTTADYLKFAQMLLNGGELDGTRIIGRKTLEFMTMNHLHADLLPYDFGEGLGCGLGFAMVMDPAATNVINSLGNYYWGSASSCAFWVDPREGLVAVLMTQMMMCQIQHGDAFRALTYQALIE